LRAACWGRALARSAGARTLCVASYNSYVACCMMRAVAVGGESTLRAYEDSRKTTNAVMARESRSPSNRPKGYSAR
jgi:hypothetical protein